VTPGHDDDSEQVSERSAVELGLTRADDLGVGAHNEQGRYTERLVGGRRRPDLEVGGGHRGLGVAVAEAPVLAGGEVDAHLLLEQRPRRRDQSAGNLAGSDSLLDGAERALH